MNVYKWVAWFTSTALCPGIIGYITNDFVKGLIALTCVLIVAVSNYHEGYSAAIKDIASGKDIEVGRYK